MNEFPNSQTPRSEEGEFPEDNGATGAFGVVPTGRLAPAPMMEPEPPSVHEVESAVPDGLSESTGFSQLIRGLGGAQTSSVVRQPVLESEFTSLLRTLGADELPSPPKSAAAVEVPAASDTSGFSALIDARESGSAAAPRRVEAAETAAVWTEPYVKPVQAPWTSTTTPAADGGPGAFTQLFSALSSEQRVEPAKASSPVSEAGSFSAQYLRRDQPLAAEPAWKPIASEGLRPAAAPGRPAVNDFVAGGAGVTQLLDRLLEPAEAYQPAEAPAQPVVDSSDAVDRSSFSGVYRMLDDPSASQIFNKPVPEPVAAKAQVRESAPVAQDRYAKPQPASAPAANLPDAPGDYTVNVQVSQLREEQLRGSVAAPVAAEPVAPAPAINLPPPATPAQGSVGTGKSGMQQYVPLLLIVIIFLLIVILVTVVFLLKH